MLTTLLFAITYAFACVVQPGPFQAFLLSESLTHGWRKTVPLVFAPLFSDIPVIVLVIFVLTKIPAAAIQILQCFGGAYLLFLAYQAFQTWRTFNVRSPQEIPARRNFFKAVFGNVLNPNPYLGWSLVMGPLLIKCWNDTPIHGILMLISFYGSLILYSILMIFLFAAAGSLGPRINKVAIGISVIALAGFGGYYLWAGMA